MSLIISTALAAIATFAASSAPMQAAPKQVDPVEALSERAAQLFQEGKYVEATPLMQECVKAAEAAFGPADPKLAKFLFQMAMVYFAQARYTEAVPVAQRVLAISEARFGKKSPDVINSVKLLGAVYTMKGDLDAAEPLLKRAVSLSLKHHGKNDPETAKQLGNLGGFYIERGRYAEAKRHLEQALAIWGEDPDPIYGAMTIVGRAKVAEHDKDLDQASLLFQKGLALRKRAFGADHPQTKNISETYSDFLKRTGRAK